MEKDLTVRRSPYFSGGCTTSPSCFSVHDEFLYSRIHCPTNNKRGGRWRNLFRRFVREGKTICGSKPLSFQYDPLSYSQNFDEGCHLHDPRRISLIFHGVSAAAPALARLESTAKHE